MLLAFGIGAWATSLGTAITGTDLVWDITFAHALEIMFANVLGLMIGFMLGVLIRNSAGAIVAYFVYSLVLPTLADAAGHEPAVVPRPAAVGGLQLRPGGAVQRRPDR